MKASVLTTLSWTCRARIPVEVDTWKIKGQSNKMVFLPIKPTTFCIYADGERCDIQVLTFYLLLQNNLQILKSPPITLFRLPKAAI